MGEMRTVHQTAPQSTSRWDWERGPSSIALEGQGCRPLLGCVEGR